MADIKTDKSYNWGPIFVLLSGVTFSLSGLCIKFIPWSALAINGSRTFLALIFFSCYILITKHKLVFNKPVFIGALSIAATMILFCVANKLTTAGNAIVLQYTVPLWTMVYSALVLKKFPEPMDLFAALCILIGVAFFFIDSMSSGNMLGNFLALLSGITYVGVFSMSSMEGSDSLSSTFFGFLFCAIIGLPFFFMEDLSATPTSAWITLLILGLVQQCTSFLLLNHGLKTTPPITASLVSGIEPIINPIWVALVYGEMMTPLSIIGAAIVLIAILGYNVIKARRSPEQKEER